VPGSAVPLYSCGRRLLASYPHVPTGYDLGVNCAVQSYAGKFFFGLTADAHACSDVERLRDFLPVAFGELCRAAGVKKPRRVAPRARKPVAGKPPAENEVPRPAPDLAGSQPDSQPMAAAAGQE